MKKSILSILLVLATLVGLIGVLAITSSADSHPFTDVPEWADEFVAKVYEKGIMQGTGGTNFGSDATLTREQLVVTLYRISGSTVTGTLDSLSATFDDAADISDWAYSAVEWASKEGITAGVKEGDKLCFKPKNDVTRQEAAKFFVTFIDYMKLDAPTDNVADLKDIDTVASWAREYVDRCVAAGIINGDGNGNFAPTGKTTRVAAAKMLACLPEKAPVTDDTTKPEEQEPTVDPTTDKRVNADPLDPNSTKLGKVNLSSLNVPEGLEISNAMLVGETAAEAGQLSATGNAIHGWHESRVARTEYGTYVVYANDEWIPDYATSGNHSYVRAKSQFILVKLTSLGSEIVLSGTYDCAAGSCASNVLVGEDGIIFVTTFYIGSVNGGESAPMSVYVFDTKTDKLVKSSHVNKPFKLQDISRTHGFGYYQPVYDPSTNKIYAIYAGGEWPGYFTWFIYDVATNKWHDESYLIEVPFRSCYMHVYPDGKGGIFFIAQRDAPARAIAASYGNSFRFTTDGYLFDGLYLFIIPDMTKEEYDVREIYIPDYNDTKEFPRTGGAILPSGAAHYTGGTTYLDSKGNLFVIYTERSTYKYVVYDTKNNFKVVRVNKALSLKDSVGADYQFAMGENTKGDVYLVAVNTNNPAATLEMYRMELSASRINAPVIKDSKGQNTNITVPVKNSSVNLGQARLSFTGTRNNSVQDNTLGIVTWNGTAKRKLTLASQNKSGIGNLVYSGGPDTYNYYYYSIKLPE